MEISGIVFSGVLSSDSVPNDYLLDDPLRTKCLRSWWNRLLYRKEKRVIDARIYHAMRDCFQKKYRIADEGVFHRVWRELGAPVWTPAFPLTVGTLREIDKAFATGIIYHGPGAPKRVLDKVERDPMVSQVIHGLLHGGPFSSDLIQRRLLEAIIVKRDRNFLEAVRGELQRELNALALEPPKGAQERLVWRAFLGNVLSFLPFTYPTDGEIIYIPVLDNDGSCRRVRYATQQIPMTWPQISTPLMALGMNPQDDANASPLISFLSTTYPAGEGFAATILANFTPGLSVGRAAYRQGHENIDAWLKGKGSVQVFGMSLGGALAFHMIRHHHDKLASVDVYNPPGLYKADWNGEYDSGCDIRIYCQAGDLVSSMGVFPTGIKVALYHVVPHHGGVREDWTSSHARVFTGLEKITILKRDPRRENQRYKRRALTAVHRVLGPLVALVTICVLMAYRLIQATCYYLRRFLSLS